MTYIREIIKFLTFTRTIAIAQTLLLLGGFYVACIELRNLSETTSGTLSLQLFEDISSDRVFKNNPKIIRAIIENKPILQENGGALTQDDLDNYLILFNWADAANKSGVLSDDMIYNLHSDLLMNSYDNQEIKNYVSRLQKDDQYYYLGFVDLAKRMVKY
ncbi:MAG: hypothetical protein Greene041679_193 [Parcubacteria group bacterium Greene0416_79]|nr:MAG: hypothetical protein Greene041679_193 [Parcubacteria group bacterium Greene0416_79]